MRPLSPRSSQNLLALLLFTTYLSTTNAKLVNFDKCCVDALDDPDFIFKGQPGFICGANYTDGRPPAKPVEMSLAWCMNHCNGIQLSRIDHLSEWAGPLVGFLLPGLVFSLSIPRGWEIPLPGFLFESELPNLGSTHRTLSYLVLALGITTLETIRWVIVIFICAGPMLLGGLYEMFLDNRLLQKLVSMHELEWSAANELKKREILITLLLGNLSLRWGGPLIDAEDFIINASVTEAKARLHSLLESQASFGTVVGAPVIFYIGAFLYALLDAKRNLGDNDTSHAIALGLWYSIIVLVAIICGCLLGCNNPAALEGIISNKCPPTSREFSAGSVFLSKYKPVSIWNRGINTYQWAKDHECVEEVTSLDWIWYMGLFAALLISVPCWLAGTNAYLTPEIGLGCRSFMILLYWLSQMILIAFVILKENVDNIYVLSVGAVFGILAILVAFVSAIGGTVMQITGVYRNCLCKAGVKSFLNPRGNYTIQLATDTQLGRDQAGGVWMPLGGVGLCFVAVLCLYAWWYQRNIRQNCSRFIHGLEGFRLYEDDVFRLSVSMVDLELPYQRYIKASDVGALATENVALTSEVFSAQLQLIQGGNYQGAQDGQLVMEHSPLAGGLCRPRYIHVRPNAILPETLELTWAGHPDSNSTGSFIWQGNRLAWAPAAGGILDAFLAKDDKIFINTRSYGINLPDVGWTHLTLHKSQ